MAECVVRDLTVSQHAIDIRDDHADLSRTFVQLGFSQSTQWSQTIALSLQRGLHTLLPKSMPAECASTV